MKALVMQQPGTAHDFTMQEIPVPTIGPNEVLVEVHVTALNRVDSAFRAGAYTQAKGFPAILGVDFSGVVAKVGDDVSDFVPGDEVFVHVDMSMGGGLAEFAAVSAENVVKKPADVSFAEAATLGITALTAYQMVNETVAVTSNDTVLVLGAAGGVGSFTVQLAKLNGATVIASSSGNDVLLRTLGVDRVINYTVEDPGTVLAHQVDVLIDTSGHGNEALGAVKRGGRAVTCAGAFDEKETAAREITASGFMHRGDTAQMETLASLVADGKLKVVIEKEYPFTVEGIAKAYDKLDAGHTAGKLIVKVK